MGETCDRCNGFGFTVEMREGNRYPYHCSACNPYDPETDCLTEPHKALREHGRELPVTVIV